ncbi:MAG: hypothetical protein K1060chlam5_00842 [Candidatus Anoxychlamydiales bacterium]|nr:hypothetical protein [Candidatus Anoxychlamydiales bacterium]
MLREFLTYVTYPKKIKKAPHGEHNNLVIDKYKISINDVSPINGSIVEYNNDYLFIFRINEKKDKTYLGICLLDEKFKQKTPYKVIDSNTSTAEDPRIFKNGSSYFIVYNDKLSIKHFCRAMFIAKLDENFNIEYKTCLDLHIKAVEKNWVPFVDNNKILLSYNPMPHKVMHLKDPKINNLLHLCYENNPCFSRFFWDYGTPRGGTPAILIDDMYLSFFHSSFGKSDPKWYVMGAYLYDSKEPYKVKKVSKHPIIFGKRKSIFSVFPCGIAIRKKNKKNQIIISYGENDIITNALVIDKDKLYSQMKDVY